MVMYKLSDEGSRTGDACDASCSYKSQNMEKTVKKNKKKERKAFYVVRKPLGSFKTLHEKKLYRKLMQILNDPTQPVRHYTDSRRSNRSGRYLLLRTDTNRHKASFLPSALSVFNENYTSH